MHGETMKKKKIYIFLLGATCFFVSQILIRIPILTYIVYPSVEFSVWQVKSPIFVGILIAFSAGLFEEGFRFLYRRGLLKSSESLTDAIIFGLGHSLMEIVYIFLPLISQSGFSLISPLAYVERIIATIFHIEMTIIIWNGFYQNKKYRGLLLAILFHGLLNSIIPISQVVGLGSVGIEASFLVLVLLIGILIYKTNRMEW